MTPWELASTSEHSQQRALFAWANCAAHFGFKCANDPRGYTLAERATGWPWVAPPVPELAFMFAIHNQGHGDKIRGSMAKAEGVKAGVPDVCLPVVRPKATSWGDNHPGLYIELKRPKDGVKAKGKTSPDQDRWALFLRNQGYKVEVAVGWQEAARIIEEYMK